LTVKSTSQPASRPPEQLIRESIRFIGEQDGPTERELKTRFIDLFHGEPTVKRAYLAQADERDGTGIHVVLCVRSSSGEDTALVRNLANIFAEMFGSHEHLDILFIREDQEREVQLVCHPFYAVS
jgi:hypothetical protein